MHGEYKMPGGKLIVADLEVNDDHLDHVQISGDFFLEPDSALEQINRALQGLPANATEQVMSDAIAAALPGDTIWYGISPQAVAVAVQRALEQAS